MADELSSKSTKRFAKVLLGITAIFAVFACSFAAILLSLSNGLELNVFVLVCCLAASPLIVFLFLIIFQGFTTRKWEKKII